jgi:allophanate hydrolase
LLSLDPEDGHNIWIERLDLVRLEPYLKALEQSDPAGKPLYGVPFAIKDNIDLAGVDTTAACEAFRYRPQRSATVVQRLIDAGAIPLGLGKTNMDQFATGLVGTRSPWGPGRNALNPDYLSGGSSSGSALATALGQASFALGTDTAGSGRVPAAFNNLIGLKPTRGILSCSGVVPACRSLDCVSVFTLGTDDANAVLAVAEGHDPQDAYSRRNPFDNGPRRYAATTAAVTIGVPGADFLDFQGDDAAAGLYGRALACLRDMGHELREVDVSGLLEAGRLLYEGPWVAERYAAIEELLRTDPGALLPVTREIIRAGREPNAVTAFRASYALQGCRQATETLFESLDCLVLPTVPTCYSIRQAERDPVALNSRLGAYTNGVNLLDLAALAVPAGFLPSGVGFGVTLVGPAFSDRRLLSLANAYCQARRFPLGAMLRPLPRTAADGVAPDAHVDLAVCGAHLSGMRLNWQLTERGAQRIRETRTAGAYRLYAMADGRPALIRDELAGTAIAVEVWRLSRADFGSFVAEVPAPLGIGRVELTDGHWCPGFIAEPRAVSGAEEISHLGGWRAYMAERA